MTGCDKLKVSERQRLDRERWKKNIQINGYILHGSCPGQTVYRCSIIYFADLTGNI
jgi:hypothetical protein